MAHPVPDRTRRYTIADLYAFPPDGHRYELVRGRLLVTPPPRTSHDRAVTALVYDVVQPCHRAGLYVAMRSATGEYSADTWLEPDLAVFDRDFATRGDDWLAGPPPLLAIEVLSRGSRAHDRGIKRATYLALGVREYWVVDPFRRVFERWRGRDDGGSVELATFTTDAGGVALTVDVPAFFARALGSSPGE